MKISLSLNNKVISFLLVFCLILSTFIAAPAFAGPSTEVKTTQEGVTPQQIDTMAIDPQSWSLHRDLSFNDLHPNPVVDWMEELDARSLENPKAAGNKDPIYGGLILIEYLDRKFMTGHERGSDPLGYYLFNEDCT